MVDRFDLRITTWMPNFGVLTMVGVYLGLHFMQHHGLGPEVLRFYGKDFLAVPLLLEAVGITAQLLGKPVALKYGQVLLAAIYMSLVFEWLLPRYADQYFGDWLDVVAYAAGATLYCIYLRKYKPGILGHPIRQ